MKVIRAVGGRPTATQLQLIAAVIGSRERLGALRALHDAGDRRPVNGRLAMLAVKRMVRSFRLLGLSRRDVAGLELGRMRRHGVRH